PDVDEGRHDIDGAHGRLTVTTGPPGRHQHEEDAQPSPKTALHRCPRNASAGSGSICPYHHQGYGGGYFGSGGTSGGPAGEQSRLAGSSPVTCLSKSQTDLCRLSIAGASVSLLYFFTRASSLFRSSVVAQEKAATLRSAAGSNKSLHLMESS